MFFTVNLSIFVVDSVTGNKEQQTEKQSQALEMQSCAEESNKSWSKQTKQKQFVDVELNRETENGLLINKAKNKTKVAGLV